MRFLSLLLLFLLACHSPEAKKDSSTPVAISSTKASDAGGSPKTNEPSSRPEIAAIRAEYSRINALQLTPQKFQFQCDEQTKVSLFKENDSVVKVAIDWGWVGDAATLEEYYYQNGQLIFRYVRNKGGIGDQPNTVHEARTYVTNDRVIRYLQGDREVPCSNCRFTTSSKEYKVLRASSDEEMKKALCR